MGSYLKNLFVGGCVLTLTGCVAYPPPYSAPPNPGATQWVNPDYSQRSPQVSTGVSDTTNQNVIAQQLGAATRSAQSGDCSNSLLYQRDAALTLQTMAQRVTAKSGQSARTDLSALFLGAADMFSSLQQFTIYCGAELAAQRQRKQHENMGYSSSMRSLSHQAEVLGQYMSSSLSQGKCDQALGQLSTVAELSLSLAGQHRIPLDFDQQSAYLDALANGEKVMKVSAQVVGLCLQ